ncbi:MAG TPA: hypothetical protein VL728_03915 [Cyclobacteriaceae bacterium]|jgi:hypothetical protein|nr:hypothetical protein [Cyclobacteriaceae bacterium]
MKRIKKILRSIFLAHLLLLALAGVPVIGNLYERKRDDLFDNEIKMELVEKRKEKTELPSILDS